MADPAVVNRDETALIKFDRGHKKGYRTFVSAHICQERPCVVTQYGAIQFEAQVAKQYHVDVGYVHEGSYRPIGLFQQSTTLEEKLGERLLNRYPNRKIVNLTRMVEAGQTRVIYLYGIRLQYDLEEGDPIIVTLRHIRDQDRFEEYYFRYHQTGPQADIDLALVFPLQYFWPNPGGRVDTAARGMAFSFSVGHNMDPERRYGWLRKIGRAVRLNLYTGVVERRLMSQIGTDRVIRSNVDGFAGLGLTFFEFITAGYGINVIRPPRAGFPFIGIEVKHAYEFIRSLRKDSHSQWEKFRKLEDARTQQVELPETPASE